MAQLEEKFQARPVTLEVAVHPWTLRRKALAVVVEEVRLRTLVEVEEVALKRWWTSIRLQHLQHLQLRIQMNLPVREVVEEGHSVMIEEVEGQKALAEQKRHLMNIVDWMERVPGSVAGSMI